MRTTTHEDHGNTPAGQSKYLSRIVLGNNQYGKAEVRLVKVARDTDRHSIEDLNITSQLHGEFELAFTVGDNSQVVATDTQKNTIYALAKDGVGSPEEFLLRLGRHFTENFGWVSGGRWAAEQYSWDRIDDHDHAFSKNKSEIRTAVLLVTEDDRQIVAGIDGLTVLKSTGSEFHGFPRDKYTTLVETTDRILATDVTARWRYNTLDVDYNQVYSSVRGVLLTAFASTHSMALQQSMFQMGKQVLEAHAEIGEIRLSLPNNHHFLVDLAPFGLENNNEIFFVADRPYGLVEATIEREGSPGDAAVWANTPGFC